MIRIVRLTLKKVNFGISDPIAKQLEMWKKLSSKVVEPYEFDEKGILFIKCDKQSSEQFRIYEINAICFTNENAVFKWYLFKAYFVCHIFLSSFFYLIKLSQMKILLLLNLPCNFMQFCFIFSLKDCMEERNPLS